MAAIGILAAGVAHEINNPLAYAMGNLSFAIEHLQGLAESTPELAVVVLALRDALEGTERVRRTVRDLKVFSRPDSDRKGPVDVEKVLQAAISMAWEEIQHRARLTTDFGPVSLVTGSEAHLAQVFLTLLLYAAHGFDEGQADSSEILVVVRSTPPDRVTVRITGRTRAASGAPTVGFSRPVVVGACDEGVGFGLAFCRRLIGDDGGDISVESERGQESGFKVVLPVSKEAARSSWVPSHGPGTSKRAKVLVVDDEPRIGSAIARILGPLHEVTAVCTARDATMRLEGGEQYDVILCDLMMPQMSGIDLYRSVEQLAPELTNRVVFMTGGPFSMRGSSLLEALTNPRLEKPFSPDALRSVVEQVMSQTG